MFKIIQYHVNELKNLEPHQVNCRAFDLKTEERKIG